MFCLLQDLKRWLKSVVTALWRQAFLGFFLQLEVWQKDPVAFCQKKKDITMTIRRGYPGRSLSPGSVLVANGSLGHCPVMYSPFPQRWR